MSEANLGRRSYPSNFITAAAKKRGDAGADGGICEVTDPLRFRLTPIRLRNAALNFSFLRRLAINLFRADKSRAASLPKKRKAAAWNPDYLATVLKLREI